MNKTKQEQIETDIKAIQKMEKQLFDSIKNDSLVDEQYENAKNKIKDLMNMRIRLYKILGEINETYVIQSDASIDALSKQRVAINVIEEELNTSAQKLEALENERNNKLRLVEINEYYEDRYEEHIYLMKMIIVCLVILIVIALINKTGLLPRAVYYGLIGIVATVASYYIWKVVLSIMMRDKMVYSEYKWNFNASSAPAASAEVLNAENDPWTLPTVNTTCIGSACCTDDQEYDYTTNKCKYIDNNVEAFSKRMHHL